MFRRPVKLHDGPYETNELIIHARPASERGAAPRRRHFAAAVRESGALFSMTIARESVTGLPLVHKENTFVAVNPRHTPFVRTVSADARVMAVINATRVQSKHSASVYRDNVSFGTRRVPFPTSKRDRRHKIRNVKALRDPVRSPTEVEPNLPKNA